MVGSPSFTSSALAILQEQHTRRGKACPYHQARTYFDSQPDQWSFPLDLPAPLLGIDTGGSGGGELVDTATGSAAYAAAPDLTAEFEVKLLRPKQRYVPTELN